MENASKALLIAGTVLVVILIITLCVFVLGKANEPMEEARGQITEEEILMFNNQFTKYAGKNVSAINTKELITAVISNNSKSGNNKRIILTYNEEEIGSNFQVDSKKKYEISVLTDDKTGLVNRVLINDNSN